MNGTGFLRQCAEKEAFNKLRQALLFALFFTVSANGNGKQNSGTSAAERRRGKTEQQKNFFGKP